MKCRNCIHCGEDAVSSYFGSGLYWIAYCNYLPHRQKLVDANIERECEDSEEGMMVGYCSSCGNIIFDVTDETHAPSRGEELICRACGAINRHPVDRNLVWPQVKEDVKDVKAGVTEGKEAPVAIKPSKPSRGRR